MIVTKESGSVPPAKGLDDQGGGNAERAIPANANTRGAIRGFQTTQGMIPDGYLSAALLARVRAAAGG